ncbi:hypothetical protein ACG0Z6_00370 [Roseateles sp. BYS180W]|uniref:Phosphate ABC transporter substrate-binding protein n=1 Tax=Roseateles rivi TaxID=3299028 RepID=A0ABW7FQT9_9BURK
MKCLHPTLLALAALVSGPCWADVYVVVSTQSPVKSLTQRELQDIFLSRSRTFPSGEFATPLDQPRQSPVRQEFYFRLTGMGLPEINSYWARLSFAGQSMPPQPMATQEQLLQTLRRNPLSISYLAHEPRQPGLRVVLQLKDP